MKHLTEVPMPNTAHPGLEQYAEAVRNSTVDPLLIPIVRPMRAYVLDPSETAPISAVAPRSMVLSKRKAGAPAPFVGDPVLNDARYFWWVWTDEVGRHITTDAELVWRFDPTPPKRTHHRNLRLP